MIITQLSLTLGVQLDSRRDTRHTWSKWMMTPMDPPHLAHTLSPSRVTLSNTPSIGHVWRELHRSMQSLGGAGSVHWNLTIYFSVQREPHWTRDQNFFHTASTKISITFNPCWPRRRKIDVLLYLKETLYKKFDTYLFSHDLYLLGLLVLAIPSALFWHQIFVLNFKFQNQKLDIFLEGSFFEK